MEIIKIKSKQHSLCFFVLHCYVLRLLSYFFLYMFDKQVLESQRGKRLMVSILVGKIIRRQLTYSSLPQYFLAAESIPVTQALLAHKAKRQKQRSHLRRPDQDTPAYQRMQQLAFKQKNMHQSISSQTKIILSFKKYKRASLYYQTSFIQVEYLQLKLMEALDHKDIICLFLKMGSLLSSNIWGKQVQYLIQSNSMVKYVSQDRSKTQKASSSESEKGRNAVLEKSTNTIISKLVRKRLAACTKTKKKCQKKVRKCSESFNSSLHDIMKPDQFNCSICYEILAGPVLLSCGHFFCLHCLDKAVFRNGQCPLCRHQIGGEDYKPSKQLMTLLDKFLCSLQGSDHQNYLKRVKEFQIIERKRLLPKSLKIGDFVDLNINQTWISAQIKGIYNTYMTLRYICKGQPVYLKVDVNSRRIATQYTFTKEPPLKPTYFTSNFNYNEPVLRYIVEPPTYTVRVPRRSQSNLVVDNIEEQRDWDHFEPIRQNNDWLSEDPVLLPIELQGLSQLDENELLLGH